MTDNRDNFSQNTKIELAKRVSYRCSNPDCRKITIGPTETKYGTVSIGIACHIYAASPNGPRSNPNLSSNERKSIDNGIWLCSNCSIMIDKDAESYPPELLYEWKKNAEANALTDLKNSTQSNATKNHTVNYSIINNAIIEVLHDDKLIAFLKEHDFTQPYYRPVLNSLYELMDIILMHSDQGSPYDELYKAIFKFRTYLSRNAFWVSYDVFLLGKNRKPEDPRILANSIINILRDI